MKLSILIILQLQLILTLGKVRYDGYQVHRLTPRTQRHVKFIEKLKQMKGLMFWEGPNANVGRSSDIMIPPHLNDEFLGAVQNAGVENFVYMNDVQALMDDIVLQSSNESSVPLINWNQYSSLETIYKFLEDETKKHPNDTQIIQIGKSFEGRGLQVLKIAQGRKFRPSIWIDSNIHAREWISGATVTYLINEILNSDNPEIKKWKYEFNFYILPIANPDGFVYSQTKDRLWRKTRSNCSNHLCIGVDANRNFPFKWASSGSSLNPCDDTYAGSEPLSEVESKAIASFYDTIASEAVGFFSVHSYSQLILFPYGVAGQKLNKEQYEQYVEVANNLENAFQKRYGTKFQSGAITEILYPASGGSIDWVKSTYDTNLTMAFELRDRGKYGFLLPPSQIIPSCLEFMDGFAQIIRTLRQGVHNRPVQPKLKIKLPSRNPIIFENESFGNVPNENAASIIPGFQRQ